MDAAGSLGADRIDVQEESCKLASSTIARPSPVHALQDRIASSQNRSYEQELVWTPLARLAFTLGCSGILWTAIGVTLESLVQR